MALDKRPKMFPAPEFPPRKPKAFARTPPAIYPVFLGLIGLALALRKGLAGHDLAAGPLEAAIGALLGAWAFAMLALAVKIARRPGVLAEDMRVLPGRTGIAAASVSVMAAAGLVIPYAPGLALGLIWAGLALHAASALLLFRVLLAMPAEARGVNPGLHLSFVGFIVAAVPAAALGQIGLASALLWLTMPVAALIWGISLAQLITRIPPAPLRPMLAIHLAPAALFTTVAALVGQPVLAMAFASFGAVMLTALLLTSRWICAAGFSPMWGAFGFPLAAYALAMLTLGGAWALAGKLLLGLAFVIIPPIAYQVLRLWPAGRLAAKTNATEA